MMDFGFIPFPVWCAVCDVVFDRFPLLSLSLFLPSVTSTGLTVAAHTTVQTVSWVFSHRHRALNCLHLLLHGPLSCVLKAGQEEGISLSLMNRAVVVLSTRCRHHHTIRFVSVFDLLAPFPLLLCFRLTFASSSVHEERMQSAGDNAKV